MAGRVSEDVLVVGRDVVGPGPDVYFHADFVGAAAEDDAFEGGDVAVVASPGGDKVAETGADVVGGVVVNPSGAGNVDGVPGVGGVGSKEFCFSGRGNGFEIAADIPGGKSASAEFGDGGVGKILADAGAFGVHFVEWGEGVGGFGVVGEHFMDAAHEVVEGFVDGAAGRKAVVAGKSGLPGNGELGAGLCKFAGKIGGVEPGVSVGEDRIFPGERTGDGGHGFAADAGVKGHFQELMGRGEAEGFAGVAVSIGPGLAAFRGGADVHAPGLDDLSGKAARAEAGEVLGLEGGVLVGVGGAVAHLISCAGH